MADQFITDVAGLSKDIQGTLAANAKSRGITVEEYLAERGGVNPVTKKYGDSYNAQTDLNDAEYLAAIAGKAGVEAGKALNAARDAKLKAYIAANPNSPEAIQARLEAGTQDAYGSGLLGKGTGSSYVAGTTGATGGSTTSNPYAPGTEAAKAWNERKSAYDLLYSEFKNYGLETLVTPLKDLITSGVPSSEFTLRLRETDAYKKRFAANEARIKSGLRALSEFEYITKEDAYQEVMRRRGLPPEYYTRGDMGIQKGFENLIAGDVSSTELEDRIVTAQDRVLNANPEIAATLKQFYPGISNGDILAYALDPANALNAIKRKITAAEIGVAAKAEGLTSGLTRAEELATMGVTGAMAQQGYQTIASTLPRASQLADIYKQGPYTQQTAETEVFNLAGSTEAEKQRKKLTELETRAFQGSAGTGAIARDRAGVL